MRSLGVPQCYTPSSVLAPLRAVGVVDSRPPVTRGSADRLDVAHLGGRRCGGVPGRGIGARPGDLASYLAPESWGHPLGGDLLRHAVALLPDGGAHGRPWPLRRRRPRGQLQAPRGVCGDPDGPRYLGRVTSTAAIVWRRLPRPYRTSPSGTLRAHPRSMAAARAPALFDWRPWSPESTTRHRRLATTRTVTTGRPSRPDGSVEGDGRQKTTSPSRAPGCGSVGRRARPLSGDPGLISGGTGWLRQAWA